MAEDNGVVEKQDETTEKTVSTPSLSDLKKLVFVVDKISAADMEALQKANSTVDVTTQAKYMVRYAVKVPEHWGDPEDVETFRQLDWPIFVEVRAKFFEAVAELIKN